MIPSSIKAFVCALLFLSNYSATAQPRIISLTPHTTELAFAAGAGQYLVAVDRYSDYPAAVKSLPKIGDAFKYDLEQIIALKPTHILAWHTNSTQKIADILQAQNIQIFHSEPKTLADIPKHLRALGKLVGTTVQSEAAATQFTAQLAALTPSIPRTRLRVFYQLGYQPLITLSNRDLVGQAIQLCGGQNIFGSLSSLAPRVSKEAVLQAQPQVMITTTQPTIIKQQWQQWQSIPAIKNQQFYTVNADFVSRPGPRILHGVKQICQAIENARMH